MILCNSFIPTSTRTVDKLTLFLLRQVTKPLPNPGVLVEPLLVFLEFLEVVLTEPDKELSETCAEEVVCSLLLKYGEDGIDV
jgi:hypothetical protein